MAYIGTETLLTQMLQSVARGRLLIVSTIGVIHLSYTDYLFVACWRHRLTRRMHMWSFATFDE